MAVATEASGCGLRLSCFRLNTVDAKLLATFYEQALGFRRLSLECLSGARLREISPVGGRAMRITLALGKQRIQLLQFVDQPGRPYPRGTRSSDLLFQHFAIVVSDMDAASHQLATTRAWSPITREGPQYLPPSSGGVTAFKFRDPEGHPLELLEFPADKTPSFWQRGNQAGPFLGIDHSAISVSSSARSVDFYQSLGLTLANQSINADPAQARLDDLEQPLVHVTAMKADDTPPHLELLCYRDEARSEPLELAANDVAATCLVFERSAARQHVMATARHAQSLIDPDGHHVLIVDAGL